MEVKEELEKILEEHRTMIGIKRILDEKKLLETFKIGQLVEKQGKTKLFTRKKAKKFKIKVSKKIGGKYGEKEEQTFFKP